jgi:hypothetical protein
MVGLLGESMPAKRVASAGPRFVFVTANILVGACTASRAPPLVGPPIELARHADLVVADESSRCTEEPDQPTVYVSIRPIRTVGCPYVFDELVARITRLSVATSLPDTVETVERGLGLPEMTTSQDELRAASYMMTLSGKDGWKLQLQVRESFYPVDGGPVAFEPGLRPKRLCRVEDADLRVDMHVLGPSPGSGIRPCVPLSPFLDAMVAAGWQKRYVRWTDGGGMTPLLIHGNKTVNIFGDRGSCTDIISLTQGPHFSLVGTFP